MPLTRMRMRPWLEQMIESKAIPGLTWIDKDKTMFSIPWKRAAIFGWELDKDTCLFKKWAIHSGKTCDPWVWKSNFHAAIYSQPDIEEVKDKSINKDPQAVRVFRMLPVSNKPRDKRSKANKLKLRKKICQQLEKDSLPMASSLDDKGFLNNEGCTSPGSQWSESSSEFAHVSPSDVPDRSAVEISSEAFANQFSHRFEVSPDHSPDYDYDIVEICRQLEKDSHLMSSSLDDKEFLNNEGCTSPGSEWSVSSADDVDDLPQYITLGEEFTSGPDDFWNTFCPQISHISF